MEKIIILDRDSSTLNDISRLVTALKFEPIIAYNLASVNSIPREEIAAIFVDVETKMVKVGDVINLFNGPNKLNGTNLIPVFLMFSNPGTYYIEHAKQLPHAEIIQKPFTLEEVFQILHSYINLNDISYEQFSNKYKLDQFKKYTAKMELWVEKFGSLLES